MFVLYAFLLALLFFVLSPGVLLTLPPGHNCGAFLQMQDHENCATSYLAAGVHSVVFFVVVVVAMYFCRK